MGSALSPAVSRSMWLFLLVYCWFAWYLVSGYGLDAVRPLLTSVHRLSSLAHFLMVLTSVLVASSGIWPFSWFRHHCVSLNDFKVVVDFSALPLFTKLCRDWYRSSHIISFSRYLQVCSSCLIFLLCGGPTFSSTFCMCTSSEFLQ